MVNIYIVGYLTSWGNDRNTKVITSFNDWEQSLETARRFIQPFRTVYIVEMEINKVTVPISDKNNWIDDFKHYIITTDNVQTVDGIINPSNSKITN